MEVCPEAELIAVEDPATVCDRAFQIGEGRKVAVRERLIQNGPEGLWCAIRVVGAEWVVGRAFRRCAATPASRAGSSGSAPRSRPGLRSSGPAESGRAGRDR